MKTRLLIIFTIGIIGFTGISFAEESPGSPIPEPEQESFTYTNCGPGTTYQDGICVVNQTENSNQTKNQNDKWPDAYQNDKLENPYQTKNPSECWYQEDDGSMTPCTLDDDKSLSWIIQMGMIVFWPYIVLGIVIVIIFRVWRIRK